MYKQNCRRVVLICLVVDEEEMEGGAIYRGREMDMDIIIEYQMISLFGSSGEYRYCGTYLCRIFGAQLLCFMASMSCSIFWQESCGSWRVGITIH